MSTYGMSAKDRLALFQGKAGGDDSKKAGPKKIGKLNISGPGSKKEPSPKPAPKKLVPKKFGQKETNKEEPKPKPGAKPKEEPKKEAPKGEAKAKMDTTDAGKVQKKQTELIVSASDVDLDSELEANMGMVSDAELDKPEKKKVEASKPKAEEKKAEETKKVEQKPEVKQEAKKPEPPKPAAQKKEEPKSEPAQKVETKKEVKEEAKVVVKKEAVKTVVVKKEEVKQVEQKQEAGVKTTQVKTEVKTTEVKQEAKAPAKKEEAPKPAPKQAEAPKAAPKKEDAPKPAPKKEEAKLQVPAKAPEKKPEPPKAAAQKQAAPSKTAPQPKAAAPAKTAAPAKSAAPAKLAAPAKAPAPVVEEAIDVVVVERKAKPAQPAVTVDAEEPLPEVSAKKEKESAVKKTQPKAAAPQPVEVVEDVIEVVAAKKVENVPVAPVQPAAPPKPKPVVKTVKPMQIYRPSGDDFYNTIFYFSGMGSVVGSSLSKGIYVPDRLTRTSLDVDVVEKIESYKPAEQKRRDTVVESARNQAVDLTEELRKLRALLFGLPSWGDSANEGAMDPNSMRRVGGEAPQQMAQPAQGLNLINQANMAMAQSLPPPKPKPAPSRPAHRPAPPPAPAPAPVMPVAPVAPAPLIEPVMDPLALASAASTAAQRRRPEPAPPAPKGGVNMYGVFPSDIKTAGGANRPWQERYGNKRPTGVGGGGGEVDSQGLKPWQASRLRGLEARGYEFKRPPTKTGADYGGDAFCGAKATIELAKEDDIGSYTPYLVSGRTKQMDMRKLLAEGGVPDPNALSLGYTNLSASTPNLPYCDL